MITPFTLLMLLAVCLLAAVLFQRFGIAKGAQFFANSAIANVTPEGKATFPIQDAAFAARYLIAKRGATALAIDVCGAADVPLGIVEDETPSDGDLAYPMGVAILGAVFGTRRAVASAAIAADALVVPAAGGKCRTLPVAAGTYWIIGKAFTAAGADNDQFQLIPCLPHQVTVTAG